VLELAPADTTVVVCCAERDVLDAMVSVDGALALRVAPDEALIVGPGHDCDALLDAASGTIAARDPHALVVDQSDAWAVWALRGTQVAEALARLTAFPIPSAPGFAQGLVAHVPGKLIVQAGGAHVMVPSSLGHHLRARVMADCDDLHPVERPREALAVELPTIANVLPGS
jgi:hypothetical protein